MGKIYRMCSYFCHNLVEGKPLDPEPPLCDEHKQHRKTVILRNIRQRYIDINYWRVYDETKEQLCIFCGKPTAKNSRTFCDDKSHNSAMYDAKINGKYSFSYIRSYLCGSECHICGAKQTVYNWRDPKKTITMNLHHIIPIHKLDDTNWLLVFDPKNLITLCNKCHKLVHSKVIEHKYPTPKPKRHKSVVDWL